MDKDDNDLFRRLMMQRTKGNVLNRIRKAQFKQFWNSLAEDRFDNADKFEKAISRLTEPYHGRLPYSIVTELVYEEGKDSKKIDNILQNITLLIEKTEHMATTNEILIKLNDHIRLAILQKDNFDELERTLDLEQAKAIAIEKKAEETQRKLEQANDELANTKSSLDKALKEFEKSKNGWIAQVLGILSIFTALSFFLSGTFSSLSAIAEAIGNPALPDSRMYILIASCLFLVIVGLFTFRCIVLAIIKTLEGQAPSKETKLFSKRKHDSL